MGYYKKTIKTRDTLIVEKGYSYYQGLHRFHPRGLKEKPTSEAMQKVNFRNAVRKLTALLNLNFFKGDLHLVLTYAAENRPDAEMARLYLVQFIRKMRALYREEGKEMKYVHATEYKNKAIHHHLVVNYMELGKIQALWSHGAVRPTVIYSANLKKLAEYFVKETAKSFQEESSPYKQRYIPSRNLVRPKPVKEEVKAEQWVMEPRVPYGYYLDQDSVENGISEVTGYPYQYYVLVRLTPETIKDKWRRACGVTAPM